MNYLRFSTDELPVSVNKLYFFSGGRRRLSAEGRKYKTKFVTTRGGCTVQNLMSFDVDADAKYVLRLWFRMAPTRLYNRSYGTDKRVKSPFRDVDASNLVKLVEDSISELIGVRDRNNWIVLCQKVESEEEGVDALLYKLDFDKELRKSVDETARTIETAH